tara:strand:- start:104 stop:412 length:309 start_codon:yes stop_codon:yes gene_type:complete
MSFRGLDKLINLADGYRRQIKIDQLDLLLLQTAGRVFIIQSRCPHREAPLLHGDVEAGIIYCPNHQFAFNLQTGHQLEDLCSSLKTFLPVYEGNEVGIWLDD